MKLWHKLRNGAYFVDILLLIGAIIAILGLATFVHLHTSKAPSQASKKGTIGINTQHLDAMSLDESGSTTPTTTNNTSQAIGPADSSVSSQLQSAMTAPEASSPATACGTSCDNIVLTTPIVTTPQIPIAVDPIVNPIKPCNGLLQKQINYAISGIADHIECPLNLN